MKYLVPLFFPYLKKFCYLFSQKDVAVNVQL